MKFKVKALSLAIGLSASSLAVPSYALLISSTVESSASITINNGQTYTDTNGPSQTSVNSAKFNTPDYNYPYGGSSAQADISGNTQVLSMGPWYTQIAQHFSAPFTFETYANATYKAVITNDSTTTQNLNFNFMIAGGTITSRSEQIQNNNYITAGYSADILINGVNSWNSAAQAKHDSSGQSVSFSGTNLGGTASEDYYYWDNHSNSLSLGFLNPGQSLTIEYSLKTYVNEFFQDDGYSYTPYASIGDPFDFNASPLFAADKFVDAGTPSTNVSEPLGVALLGAGLAGLAFRRKSKAAKA